MLNENHAIVPALRPSHRSHLFAARVANVAAAAIIATLAAILSSSASAGAGEPTGDLTLLRESFTGSLVQLASSCGDDSGGICTKVVPSSAHKRINRDRASSEATSQRSSRLGDAGSRSRRGSMRSCGTGGHGLR